MTKGRFCSLFLGKYEKIVHCTELVYNHSVKGMKIF